MTAETIAGAKRQALLGLSTEGPVPVGERLAAYYDIDGNYVGATFSELAPNEWLDLTAADLHATSLMSVDIGPRATRRLLTGPNRAWVISALRSIPDHDLLTADTETLEAMYDFYLAVKDALSSTTAKNPNPWVTASKLCARKRPPLFPVRDRNVCRHLGILKLGDVRADLQVFRALVQDDDVRRAIEVLPEAAQVASGDRELAMESSDLRLLDAALWTYTVMGAGRDRGELQQEPESALHSGQ